MSGAPWLEAVFEDAAVALGIATPEGRWLRVNPALGALVGRSPAELRGRAMDEHIHPGDVATGTRERARVSTGEARAVRTEQRWLAADGRTVRVVLDLSALAEVEGGGPGLFVQAEDVTGLSRAEAEAGLRALEQATVAGLGERALAGADLKELLEEGVAAVAEALDIELAVILEVLPGGETLHARAGVGWRPGVIGSVGPLDRRNMVGRTLVLNEPTIVEDVPGDERLAVPPIVAEHGVLSGMAVVIHEGERPFGALAAYARRRRAFSPDDVSFVQVVAHILGAAIARRRAEAEIGALAAERGRLVAQALEADEREARRLSEALHDGAVQQLLAARQELMEARRAIDDPRLDRALEEIGEAVRQLREEIAELHPVVLEHAGLAATLRSLGERRAERGGFELDLRVQREVEGSHDALLIALVRELLTNAAKHAQARRVEVRIVRDGDRIRVDVVDDGVGMEPGSWRAAAREGHIGLASTAERIEAVGGTFAIGGAPGRGTQVSVTLPAGPVAPGEGSPRRPLPPPAGRVSSTPG